MPALTYFWIAHQSWTDPGAMLATVICSCALMFTTLVLYKLDFYVEKQRMRIYKAVVVCAPLVSCAAVQSWAHARHVGGGWHVAEELIQWLLVFATCLLHSLEASVHLGSKAIKGTTSEKDQFPYSDWLAPTEANWLSCAASCAVLGRKTWTYP